MLNLKNLQKCLRQLLAQLTVGLQKQKHISVYNQHLITQFLKNHKDSEGIEAISEKVSQLQLFSSDPALFAKKKLHAADITLLLREGPCQPPAEFLFPKDRGRCFQHQWFCKNLPHDTINQRRSWLSYSISSDKAFCMTCLLFGGPLASTAFAFEGWNDWTNGSRALDRHEVSKEHKGAEIARIHWESKMTLERISLKCNNAITEENRRVVSCVIDCLKFLASDMIALRGHNSNNGKLLNLFRLLSKYNPSAAAYIDRIDKCKKESTRMAVNFLSPSNIQLLLTTIRKLITNKILKSLLSHKKCAITADGTYNSSKKEATVILLRYIEFDANGLPIIVERLIDIFTTGETSGIHLRDRILKSLKDCEIDLQWLVGQGYDGAGNVCGKCSGLKTKIQELNNKAVYIWCYGHRLNLVIEATVSCCVEVKNALGLLEELYVFFSGHRRNAKLMENQGGDHKRQLKRVMCTRWNSKEAAVNTAVHCFSAVLMTLDDLATNGEDSATVSGAHGISVRLRDFRFIVTLFVLKELFEAAGPASRQLQGVSMDLAMAAHVVSDCRQKFETMRQSDNIDVIWMQILDNAKCFATEHNIDTVITERHRKKKRMDGELATDEIQNGEQRMKLSMFVPILDHLCTQMADRFGDDMTSLMTEMSLFASDNLRSGSAIKPEDIKHLADIYCFDADDVSSEYADFCNTYDTLNLKSDHRPMCVQVQKQAENEVNGDASHSDTDDSENNSSESEQNVVIVDVVSTVAARKNHSFILPLKILTQLSGYPNLLRVYWTLATLPVTSCSAERTLSRLRMIKNRLRSSMCDECLKSLIVIAAEQDLLRGISNDLITDAFAGRNSSLRRQLTYI